MNFSLCLCECKLYKLENQDDKNFDQKTGLPKFPVISSVEGKSSCKAYFLMSSVMLA